MTDRTAAHKAMDAYLDAGGPADFVIISRKDMDRNFKPAGIDEDHAANLIEIGVDLGVFTVSNLLLEGAALNQKALQALSDLCAMHIQELTGMPAEDFALKVAPVVEKVIKSAKEKQ